MIDAAQTLDRVVLLGADQVCRIANFLGLTVDIKTGAIACPYSGSYAAGIIFWALVLIFLLLLISVTRPKSSIGPR
ncbi:MAG TPA: hypothetical protein VET84_00965 [Stellaceae bacterium]|jgi:hypothetical protein|nr:hypothetical protein [Stellaceae bacterium]